VQNYAVVIHEDPEGGFWAEVPALPGCYSQGETVDKLKHNIREAIAGIVEVLREEGREPDSNAGCRPRRIDFAGDAASDPLR
jgi:predicted RNase H-like HicB family nuclease